MHRSTSFIVAAVLAWLPSVLAAQTSRAPQAVGSLTPTSVGSAPTTLPDGTKLFRRDGVIEVWKGDAVERIEGMVVRDATGRHWAVEFKGYMS